MRTLLRVGFIGAGANARAKHIPGFKAITGVTILAVCNRTRESSERVAREFGIPRVAADWHEIVYSPDIDAICIGTWPYMHAELTIAALQAGKHVLTEARMARDLLEAKAMFAESVAHPNLVTQVVPAPMSLPFDTAITDLLARNALGELREVSAICTHGDYVDATAPFNWRQSSQLSGRNTLSLGIYYEILLRWIRCAPKSVMADAATFNRRRCNERGEWCDVDIPDRVTVIGEYAGASDSLLAEGARLIMHCSAVETTKAQNEFRLNGTRAGLRLDLAKNELWVSERGEIERLVEVKFPDRGGWRVEEDFVASIRTGRPVTLTDFETGVRYMHFTDAVWESWSSGGERVQL